MMHHFFRHPDCGVQFNLDFTVWVYNLPYLPGSIAVLPVCMDKSTLPCCLYVSFTLYVSIARKCRLNPWKGYARSRFLCSLCVRPVVFLMLPSVKLATFSNNVAPAYASLKLHGYPTLHVTSLPRYIATCSDEGKREGTLKFFGM